jgi:hypothetical protein
MREVMAALVLALAAAASVAEGAEKAGPVLKEKCDTLGRAFYRLAEQRDAGVGTDTAVVRVGRRLNEEGRTGGHTKTDFTAMLKPLAQFVYANSQLSTSSLGSFGRHSCRLEGMFGDDRAKSSLAAARLLDAAQACQSEHGSEQRNPAVGLCIERRREAIAEQLRDAKVEVRERR